MTSDELKQSVSMRELVEQYGYHPNRAGFISCPFHYGDRSPSMKIYPKDYHCHACGANGDIFSFVMGMEHCDFKTAFERLGGTYQHHENEYQRKKYLYQLEKRKENERRKAMQKEQLKADTLEDIKYQKLFKQLSPVFSDDWCEAVNKLEYDFYVLNELTKRGETF
jgi:DNA primase